MIGNEEEDNRHREGLKQYSFLLCSYLSVGKSTDNRERSSLVVSRNTSINSTLSEMHMIAPSTQKAESVTLGWGPTLCVLTRPPGEYDTA